MRYRASSRCVARVKLFKPRPSVCLPQPADVWFRPLQTHYVYAVAQKRPFYNVIAWFFANNLLFAGRRLKRISKIAQLEINSTQPAFVTARCVAMEAGSVFQVGFNLEM